MVARVKLNNGEELVVTLTDAMGAVFHRETCADGGHAASRACLAIARRERLQAGDLLRVTVPQPDGEPHQPREMD